MFEQHPVPQQISSYQFRLVGDMTLKQFFQLAAGAVLGIIVYATPLPSIFKWPIIIFFVVAGAAFAFLPLQERPLEEWMLAFFRAIYGPTIYTWRKGAPENVFARNTAGASEGPSPTTVASDASVAKLDASESSFLNNLTGMFGIHPKAHTDAAPASSVVIPTPVLPTIAAQGAQPAKVLNSEATIQPPVQQPPQAQQLPHAGDIFVATPATQQVTLPKSTEPVVSEKEGTVANPQVTSAAVEQTFTENQQQTAAAAQFSPDAAPPTPATLPNVIVGQVMTTDGHIIEGAILEVTDFQGRPVRALKTNKAGHFMIVTPLPNGQYKMVIEKEGQTFEPLTFEAHGAVIPPIAIKAKGA